MEPRRTCRVRLRASGRGEDRLVIGQGWRVSLGGRHKIMPAIHLGSCCLAYSARNVLRYTSIWEVRHPSGLCQWHFPSLLQEARRPRRSEFSNSPVYDTYTYTLSAVVVSVFTSAQVNSKSSPKTSHSDSDADDGIAGHIQPPAHHRCTGRQCRRERRQEPQAAWDSSREVRQMVWRPARSQPNARRACRSPLDAGSHESEFRQYRSNTHTRHLFLLSVAPPAPSLLASPRRPVL